MAGGTRGTATTLRVNRAPARPAVIVAALAAFGGACHAPTIAVVACGTAIDCAHNELCNSDHECVLATPPVAAGTPDAASTAPALVLDDFEEGNLNGSGALTGWSPYSYNPPGLVPDREPGPGAPGAFASVVSPGYGSASAMRLSFYMVDPPDGVPQYPGAGVQTGTVATRLDLSAYSLIEFAQRFDPLPPCEGTERVMVEIDCAALSTAFDGDVDVSTGAWAPASLPFSTFREQTYMPQTGIGVAACLSMASGMNFSVQSPPSDGACGAGSLQLDSIGLR